MNHTISPLAPQIAPILETIRASLSPLVQELADFAPFTGAVLFMPDMHHRASANTVSVVNADRRQDMLSFTNTHVARHRVDLSQSELGHTFASRRSMFARSRLFPERHVVYGLPFEPLAGTPAVVQLAFDAKTPGALPSSRAIQDAWRPHISAVMKSGRELVEKLATAQSLGDAMLLNVPAMPNAVVIKWDVIHSTSAAQHNYPLLREYLQALSSVFDVIATKTGARVVANTGDGQNLVLSLPEDISPSNQAQLRRFLLDAVQPLLARMQRAQQDFVSMFGLEVRIVAAVGYVEYSVTGEATGPVFFEASAELKKSAHAAGVHYTPSYAQALNDI